MQLNRWDISKLYKEKKIKKKKLIKRKGNPKKYDDDDKPYKREQI